MLGDESAFAPVLFVWSDQYDRKIQTVGVVGADCEVPSRTERSMTGSSSLFATAAGSRARRVQPAPQRHAVPQVDRRPRAPMLQLANA
jgi:hypothetical protein